MTGSETATSASPRLRRTSRTALAVRGLIVLSTVVRVAAAQAF